MAAAQTDKAKVEKTYTPAQQKVVDEIVALRKSGKGYPAIAKALNERKVKTFGKGKQWYGPVVRNIAIKALGGADASLKAAGTKRPQPKAATTSAAKSNEGPESVAELVNLGGKSEAKPDPKGGAKKGAAKA